ncbi:HNH endonuclease [Candidatus Sumerlaeota bacterium]|nr:HNH endonuclease [Candidatus Sumerlaeota bacterium]
MIRKGDMIAIKKRLGLRPPEILIRSIGVVAKKTRKRGLEYVRVDWVQRDVNRIVPMRNFTATIHGPLLENDPKYADWIREAFEGPFAPSTPPSTLRALDVEEPSQPKRVMQDTYRILRDTALTRQVKESSRFHRQICGGEPLTLKDGTPYAEAHHVKPLGAPHNGLDVRENILCVCPNCHVLLDYGAVELDAKKMKSIAPEYIAYHNERIFGER